MIRKKLSELSLKDLHGKGVSEPDAHGYVYFQGEEYDAPSKETETYWIGAERKKGKYPKSTKKSGKWLIFVPVEYIDAFWEKIKNATENGKLGGAAKVATAKFNPNATSSAKVICVYTYDWSDEKDVMRVREELKKLGVVQKIPYKTDEDTSSGKYVNRGNTRIGKYYC